MIIPIKMLIPNSNWKQQKILELSKNKTYFINI
nr:MAG TPA: hypothetical protein [Caudoviricetes sp.]